jgi:hypothetical protein
LVERIIQSHSDVRSVGERNDFALEMSRLAKGKCSSANPTRVEMVKNSLQIDMTDLGLAYATGVRSGLSDDKRIVDKMPINYLYCGLIHSALPNAKIVSLARSPMDSCYSAYKAFLRGPYSFTYDLDELGRYYLAFRRLTNHWRVSLPRSAYRHSSIILSLNRAGFSNFWNSTGRTRSWNFRNTSQHRQQQVLCKSDATYIRRRLESGNTMPKNSSRFASYWRKR